MPWRDPLPAPAEPSRGGIDTRRSGASRRPLRGALRKAAVLDNYAGASIVEALDAPVGRRYRWRSDITYLYDAESGTTNRVDPMCGMRVDEQIRSAPVTPAALPRRFCSAVCASLFQNAPATCHRHPSGERFSSSRRGAHSALRRALSLAGSPSC